MKSFVHKQAPICIKYRNYKNYDNSTFRFNIQNVLSVGEDISSDTSHQGEVCQGEVCQGEVCQKYVRANNGPMV